MGNRKALCIGIDEYASSPLEGCVNDAKQWADLFSNDYDVTELHNENATRSGIISVLRGMISRSSSGDVLVVTYSGHGTQIESSNNDEDDDGLDEAVVPYDYDSRGDLLVDDDIGELVSELSSGVNLTFIMDCCHSGTITREVKGFLRGKGQQRSVKERFLKIDDPKLLKKITESIRNRRKQRGTLNRGFRDQMQEVLIAACLPSETSKESGGSGLFTQAATQFLQNADGPVTHEDFVDAIREAVEQEIADLRTSSQTPTLYCARQDRGRLLFSRVTNRDEQQPKCSGKPKTQQKSECNDNPVATLLESLAAVLRSK